MDFELHFKTFSFALNVFFFSMRVRNSIECSFISFELSDDYIRAATIELNKTQFCYILRAAQIPCCSDEI